MEGASSLPDFGHQESKPHAARTGKEFCDVDDIPVTENSPRRAIAKAEVAGGFVLKPRNRYVGSISDVQAAVIAIRNTW